MQKVLAVKKVVPPPTRGIKKRPWSEYHDLFALIELLYRVGMGGSYTIDRIIQLLQQKTHADLLTAIDGDRSQVDLRGVIVTGYEECERVGMVRIDRRKGEVYRVALQYE